MFLTLILQNLNKLVEGEIGTYRKSALFDLADDIVHDIFHEFFSYRSLQLRILAIVAKAGVYDIQPLAIPSCTDN